MTVLARALVWAVIGVMPAAGVAQTLQPWMSSEISSAWAAGFRGQGVSISVIDSFSGSKFAGKLTGKTQSLTHGGWTSKEISMIAPKARFFLRDFNNTGTAIKLQSGLNVMNLSYAIYSRAPITSWDPLETSIISYAQAGRAVISKAAGNDGIAIGARNSAGNIDGLNTALRGAPSAVFVGALSTNGTVAAKASMAGYSNTAGSDPVVQQQFLVVGVNSAQMGMAGTSFAAPIISAYAAILGSKFAGATPTQIANQLLSTARQDTILNYNVAVHGRGEASIFRALAPRALR